jgi:TRAP-type uncharacterized transport system fused permease subunit
VSVIFLLRDRIAGWARLLDIADAFVVGAKYAIGVGAAAACVGIIVGIVTLTGVGFKLSTIITGFAGQLAQITGQIIPDYLFGVKSLTLFFTLIFTALVCILLGCGVPTTATYIIMVTVAAPALGLLGVEPIVAHMFVFYYGVLADITPPVALAAYAGASMAGADPFKTGNTAFRLAMAKVLVPFVFVASPAMLIVTKNFTWAAFTEVTVACIISIVMLAAGLTGYGLRRIEGLERSILLVGAILLLFPNISVRLIGLAIGLLVLALQMVRARREPAPV